MTIVTDPLLDDLDLISLIALIYVDKQNTRWDGLFFDIDYDGAIYSELYPIELRSSSPGTYDFFSGYNFPCGGLEVELRQKLEYLSGMLYEKYNGNPINISHIDPLTLKRCIDLYRI